MAGLARVNQNSWVAGVCGGFAYWLGLPAWVVRLATAIAAFGYEATPVVFAYLFLTLFMPSWKTDPDDYSARVDD